ncbi:MAG: 3-deoxy-7-phosphoheptulonate synthase [Lachnospiraceae bacterium]|nr:3-deoxy-7-phosphoheptulonate synthase [Lachnospiraceae bacterium]
MEMQMDFIRKLPTPLEVKEMYPTDDKIKKIKELRDEEIRNILSGEDDRFILVIGPCSADNEEAVLEYVSRLSKLQEEVKDKLLFIPRVYTNKPRTNGTGYKGMVHQPDPNKPEDMFEGIIASRRMHTLVVKETGLTCAEEMLYPEYHRYLSDLLSFVSVGARSVEDQQHRLTASGVGIPCGMKNPTGGDLRVMMNSIEAAQNPQRFIYRGWEVDTPGNEFALAILRGYIDKYGINHPNYHYEGLYNVYKLYKQRNNLKNPAVIVDCNHSNSNKDYMEQIRIAKDVMHSRCSSSEIHSLVKGLMIESYLLDGKQEVGGDKFGCSITDPCLGWEKTEELIKDLYDLV